jgi:hypothetical protein
MSEERMRTWFVILGAVTAAVFAGTDLAFYFDFAGRLP